MRPARRERDRQWLSGREQMPLADHLVDGRRPQPIGKGRCGIGGGEEIGHGALTRPNTAAYSSALSGISKFSMNTASFVWMVALLAAAMLVAAGFGARFGVWDFRLGFQLVRWSEYAGLAAAGLALIALVIPRWRRGRVGLLVTALVVGACVAYVPWQWFQSARSVPPINDITTDTENPPAFVALVPARAGLSVPTAYPGSATADQQRRGYPDIKPLELPLPPAAAFARALDAARGMGWEIAAADPAAGRIEATATTPWFGFHDDIVVRIVPAQEGNGAGSRVDVRSVSRVGRGDFGTNAKRIRAYLEKLAHA